MYKVIIADDEESVRERLLSQLKKFNNDFEIVGSFSNGYDTLEALEQLQPDLLITDIKMPYIDGIELIKQAKFSLPLLQTIIISGYDSFDYAKQAIDLKVIGYISKPISTDELKEVLDKAKNEIDKALSIDKNIESLQEQSKTALSLIQENDLCKLVSMKEISDAFKEKLKVDMIDINLSNTILGIFDFDESLEKIGYEKIEIVSLYLNKFINNELEGYCDYYVFNRSNQILFIMFKNQNFSRDFIEEAMSSIISKINKTCDVSISVALSEENKDNQIHNFRKLYRHAIRTLEYRTVVGANTVLFFDDIQKEEIVIGKIDDNEYKQISYSLSYGNVDECKNKVENIISKFKDPQFVDSYLYIATSVTNSLLKACANFKDLHESFMNNNEILQTVLSTKNPDQLLDFYYSLIDVIYKVNSSTRFSGVELGLKKIIEYIDSNYMDCNLSLDSLSSALSYSVSYISLLLKRDNKTFTQYLMMVRMEHAKVFLQDSNNKIVNVAEAVGYNDPYYFSHCFKKYFGESPVEYRKK